MKSKEIAVHYLGLDSLRAIAVVSVVLFHLDKRLIPGGFVGVDVFFVISGFVVSLSMSRLQIERLGAFTAVFYGRRIVRIMPALTVCLLATSLVANLFIPQAWLSDGTWKTAVAAFFGLSNFALAGPSNAYFSPRAEFNPFTHTWSLAVEEQFYLFFPLMFYAFRPSARDAAGRRIAAWSLVALTSLSLAFCWWLTAHRPNLAFYLIPARFWELGVGVGLFMVWKQWNPALARLSTGTIRLLVLVSLSCLACCLTFASETDFPFPWAIGPVVFSTALIALVVGRPEYVLPSLLMSPPVIWLGRVSYSLYLWHWPVFVLMRWTVGIESTATRVIALTLAVGLAAVSYRWMESPVRESRRIREAPRGRVVLVGIVLLSVASSVTWVMARNERKLSASVTADATSWLPDSGIAGPPDAKANCKMEVNVSPLAGGQVQTWTPEDCAPLPERLFVAGDSHAWAYSAMLRMYAKHSGREVRVLRAEGCPVFDMMRTTRKVSTECEKFVSAVFEELHASARPGDVLFLPSLRMKRFRDQWGGAENKLNVDPAERQAAVVEAVLALRPLAQRGVTVVFEAPKPLFRSPPFRCADWFNSINPICAAGFELRRAEFENSGPRRFRQYVMS